MNNLQNLFQLLFENGKWIDKKNAVVYLFAGIIINNEKKFITGVYTCDNGAIDGHKTSTFMIISDENSKLFITDIFHHNINVDFLLNFDIDSINILIPGSESFILSPMEFYSYS